MFLAAVLYDLCNCCNTEGNQRVKRYLVSTLSEQYGDKFSPKRISRKSDP